MELLPLLIALRKSSAVEIHPHISSLLLSVVRSESCDVLEAMLLEEHGLLERLRLSLELLDTGNESVISLCAGLLCPQRFNTDWLHALADKPMFISSSARWALDACGMTTTFLREQNVPSLSALCEDEYQRWNTTLFK